MNKHAYLVMAHHQFEILEKTLQMLDDSRNDFFIHIDKKAKNFDRKLLESKVRKSKIFFVDRMKVNWGGYSQIACELLLLKAAVSEGCYDYYHLISGVDLPIKPKEKILAFFDENRGTEFISFTEAGKQMKNDSLERISHYHLFFDSPFQRNGFIFRQLERVSMAIQSVLHINRLKHAEIQYAKGANWFSITDALAHDILEKEEWIRRNFRYSRCGDELFLQTLVYNSKFLSETYFMKQHMELDDYHAVLRLIDWQRGEPYVWRMEDYDQLITSDYLFARKFDLDTDNIVVDAIFKHFSISQQKTED